MATGPYYIVSVRTAKKTPLSIVTLLLRVAQPLANNDCFSGFTVLALSKYATILTRLNIVRSVIPLNINLTLKIIKLGKGEAQQQFSRPATRPVGLESH
jgi:hypothetical protein